MFAPTLGVGATPLRAELYQEFSPLANIAASEFISRIKYCRECLAKENELGRVGRGLAQITTLTANTKFLFFGRFAKRF